MMTSNQSSLTNVLSSISALDDQDGGQDHSIENQHDQVDPSHENAAENTGHLESTPDEEKGGDSSSSKFRFYLSDDDDQVALEAHPMEADDAAAGLMTPTHEAEVNWERSLSHTQSPLRPVINDPSSDDEPFAVQMSTIDEDQSLILTSAQPTSNSTGPFVAFPEETTLDLDSKEFLSKTFIDEDDGKDWKKKHFEYGHVMISYNHSTKDQCWLIADKLKEAKFFVWIDRDDISRNVLASMAAAVENAFVVVMAINEGFANSRYCRLEAEYAMQREKPRISMIMDGNNNSPEWLTNVTHSTDHFDFSPNNFDRSFELLTARIDEIRLASGVGRTDEISMNFPFDYQQHVEFINIPRPRGNVQNWAEDQVSDWLHKNQLNMFESSLTQFNGELLMQLYKMKSTSPSDYYRFIEELVSSDSESKLFDCLTFTEALESLFF